MHLGGWSCALFDSLCSCLGTWFLFRGSVITFLFFCISCLTMSSSHKPEQEFRVAGTTQEHKTDPTAKVSPKVEGKLRHRPMKWFSDFPQRVSAQAKYKLGSLTSWVLRLTHLSVLSFISCPSVLITTKSQRSHCTLCANTRTTTTLRLFPFYIHLIPGC